MESSICGLVCTLPNPNVGHLLEVISYENFVFYIPWCSKIDDNHSLLPKSYRNYYVSNEELRQLSQDTIWELELQVYPLGLSHEDFDTYDSFQKSSCVCSVIFYDCMEMEIYTKNAEGLEKIQNLLRRLGADRIDFLTSSSQVRQLLHL